MSEPPATSTTAGAFEPLQSTKRTAPMQALREGAQGPDVRDLQPRLKKIGLRPRAIDGGVGARDAEPGPPRRGQGGGGGRSPPPRGPGGGGGQSDRPGGRGGRQRHLGEKNFRLLPPRGVEQAQRTNSLSCPANAGDPGDASTAGSRFNWMAPSCGPCQWGTRRAE